MRLPERAPMQLQDSSTTQLIAARFCRVCLYRCATYVASPVRIGKFSDVAARAPYRCTQVGVKEWVV